MCLPKYESGCISKIFYFYWLIFMANEACMYSIYSVCIHKILTHLMNDYTLNLIISSEYPNLWDLDGQNYFRG